MRGFDEQSIRRISKVVRTVERMPKGRRLKRARWHGKGGGTGVIRFEVTAAGPYLGDVTPECDYVVAEVLSVSCKGAGVAVGDSVNVWDLSRCKFNLPTEVLIGTHGWATKMVNQSTIYECSDEQAAEGNCRWEITSLCCAEELYGS